MVLNLEYIYAEFSTKHVTIILAKPVSIMFKTEQIKELSDEGLNFD